MRAIPARRWPRSSTLRAQKAALFGAPDWATYQMWDRMAKDPKTALGFMRQMVPALEATQRRTPPNSNAEIKANGGKFTVKPWDWQMYASKVKAKRFDLRRGVGEALFRGAARAGGRRVLRRQQALRRQLQAAYRPAGLSPRRVDLRRLGRDGSELGMFYFDPFQRDSKRGGAWKSNFVDQSKLRRHQAGDLQRAQHPKAPEGQPQLASFDDVETMFHEFGHALHGFFADQQYARLSGTATTRDFVEYPSQVNEMWATDPEVLANYAKHYQTGAPIPRDLIDKIEAASKFDQGYSFGEVVEAALLDMKWHALSPAQAAAITTPAAVDAFETKALTDLGLAVDLVPPRYRTSTFRHIFSDPAGYSAGYYSYLWTEMLDRDTRKWFLDTRRAHPGERRHLPRKGAQPRGDARLFRNVPFAHRARPRCASDARSTRAGNRLRQVAGHRPGAAG